MCAVRGSVADDADTSPGGASMVAVAGELADVVARSVACPLAGLVAPDASRVYGVLSRAVNTLGMLAAAVLGRVQAEGVWAVTPEGRACLMVCVGGGPRL